MLHPAVEIVILQGLQELSVQMSDRDTFCFVSAREMKRINTAGLFLLCSLNVYIMASRTTPGWCEELTGQYNPLQNLPPSFKPLTALVKSFLLQFNRKMSSDDTTNMKWLSEKHSH